MISTEELRTELGYLKRNRLGRSLFPTQDSAQYLLGMPVFRGMPYKGKSPVVIPVGQHHLATEVLKNIPNKKVMLRMLISEYRAIVKALMDMEIDFQILNLQEGDKGVKRWLSEKGCRGVEFPMEKPTNWHVFPRDMFVYLETIKTILVHSKLFKLWRDRSRTCDIIYTELAEGGQILFSGNHLVTGCHPEAISRKRENKVLNQLREKGMKITQIPNAIFFALSREKRGRPISTYYESHIDRSASLLKGKNGEYFLILDLKFQTGPLIDPLPIQKSIDLVRKICEREMINVRVPKSLSIPYATSAVQFENGKVLATGGDTNILSTFADIVGSENLYVTDVPISAYPVFGAAGLHCLITERPEPLI
jgi:hypothetical protein